MTNITIRQIEAALDTAGHSMSPAMVRYYITSRDIKPVNKVGATNLFEDSVVDTLIDILNDKAAIEEPAAKPATKSKAKAKPKAKAKAKVVEVEEDEDEVEAKPAPRRRRRRAAQAAVDELDDLELDEL